MGRIGKASGRNPVMNGQRTSDRPVVPTKPPNKAQAAEAAEGRGLAKGNTGQHTASRTQSRTSAPSGLDRVREAARRDRKTKFTALFHHVTIDRLRTAFLSVKKEAAPGVDGVTWEQYQVDLEENLRDLHGRLHRGAYQARPSRRAYIPKTDGRLRPLGIATLEDKVVQRAAVEVMNAIYEADFLGFSYGFRPGRGQHDALDALAAGIYYKKVNWVFDADIRGFFDAIDHEWLMKFIEHRIADRRLLRLVRKWLAAGVMENGAWAESSEGTPQGASISPLLANIFLHYVLDLWVQQWRQRQTRGDVIITRYADDFIVGFQSHADAVQFQEELRGRLRSFGLELHPEKTRLIEFGRFAVQRREERGLGKPATFTFLGFTHICAKSREQKFLLVRRTMRERMRARLRAVKANLRRRQHLPIPTQGCWLGAVVRGYFAYHAVPTNVQALQAFRTQVERHWQRSLRRRGQRDRTNWARMRQLSRRWLPEPKIQHPWPTERFDVRTRGRSPVR
jgi:group II intron reverse transcriptase/maturase